MLGVILDETRIKPSRWRERHDRAARESVQSGEPIAHIEAWKLGVDQKVALAKQLLREASADRRRAMRQSLKGERHENDAERMGNLPPPVERAQHGAVQRPEEQIADALGNIGAPYRGLTLLQDWARSGRISKEMLDAGNEFHRLFQLAALDPLAAADMSRTGGAGGPVRHRGSIGARDDVHDALTFLGGLESLLGSCAWSVLGLDNSIRHWAGCWGGWPMDQKVAAGVVMGALGSLKVHFGY